MSAQEMVLARDALSLALKAWEGSTSYTFWTRESLRSRNRYDVCCGLNQNGEYVVVVINLPFHTANAITASFNAVLAAEVTP